MIHYKDLRSVHFEVSSYCNSSCPTCPRNIEGGLVSDLLKPNSLSIDDVKKIFPVEFVKQLTFINFCGNYGDPMMAKDIYEIIEYFMVTNPNLDLVIHTNGGMRSKEFWFKLGQFLSGYRLAHIVFSIDGLEDTNHLYRIGVEWDKLYANMEAYLNAGGKAVWDFLVFEHNQHQIEEAKELAKKLGFFNFHKGSPHGFNYNGKARVVDTEGKFVRFIKPETDRTVTNTMQVDLETFDWPAGYANNRYSSVKENAHSRGYKDVMKYYDSKVEVKDCMAIHSKEIYVDSNGGIHPCCYLGHINQDTLPINELVLHKEWIQEHIGLENINGLNKSVEEIVESYFFKIQDSWTTTFENGRNPMCVRKCGIERPSGYIRTGNEDDVTSLNDRKPNG